MDYNDELIGIINKIQTNSDTKPTHHSKYPAVKHNLIDFDDCKNDQIQSTATSPSSLSMAYEEILKQNVRFDITFFSALSIYVIVNDN